MQQQAIEAKDETIAQLMGMIQSNKGVESKQLEMHKEQHNTDKKKLAEVLNQLAKLREGIEERDRAIAALQEVIIISKCSDVNVKCFFIVDVYICFRRRRREHWTYNPEAPGSNSFLCHWPPAQTFFGLVTRSSSMNIC